MWGDVVPSNKSEPTPSLLVGELIFASALICSPLIVKLLPYAAATVGYECGQGECETVNPEERIAIFTIWLVAFTAVLSVATIMLWIATRAAVKDARESGDRRAAEFQAQLTVTQAGVEAARLSANAALKSAEISERALIDLERPIPFISQIVAELPPPVSGQPQQIRWHLINVGRTPGILMLVKSEIAKFDPQDGIPGFSSNCEVVAEETLLSAAAPIPFQTPNRAGGLRYEELVNHQTEIVFFGNAIYRDVLGNRREFSWCKLYEPGSPAPMKFTSIGGQERNYDRKYDQGTPNPENAAS